MKLIKFEECKEDELKLPYKTVRTRTFNIMSFLLVILFFSTLTLYDNSKSAEAQNKDYSSRIAELEHANYDLQNEVSSLTSQLISLDPDNNLLKTTIELSNGSYVAGIDIPAGTYDLEAVSGYGIFSSNCVTMSIGIWDESPGDATYKNLPLIHGEKFTIESGVTIRFKAK